MQVVPVDCGWSDVGSFATFEGYLAVNEHGNRQGANDVLLDSQDVTVLGTGSLRIAGLGLKDLLVVKSDDVVMLVDKAQAGETKRLLAEMEENA